MDEDDNENEDCEANNDSNKDEGDYVRFQHCQGSCTLWPACHKTKHYEYFTLGHSIFLRGPLLTKVIGKLSNDIFTNQINVCIHC